MNYTKGLWKVMQGAPLPRSQWTTLLYCFVSTLLTKTFPKIFPLIWSFNENRPQEKTLSRVRDPHCRSYQWSSSSYLHLLWISLGFEAFCQIFKGFIEERRWGNSMTSWWWWPYWTLLQLSLTNLHGKRYALVNCNCCYFTKRSLDDGISI